MGIQYLSKGKLHLSTIFQLYRILKHFFSIQLNVPAGVEALFMGLFLSLWARIFYRFASYFEHIFEDFWIIYFEND